MSTPDVNASYHDLSSLHQLRANAKTDETTAIKQAAQQFESVFMGMLMQSMRKANASFEADNPLNSQATEFFRDMHDSQMSAELSKKGALGLADLMVQQLAPQHSDTKAASQISAPSRFDIPKTKVLKQPGDQHQMMALPIAQSGFRQLDPERIVAPALRTEKIASVSRQLAEPSLISEPQNIQHENIQQLAAEVIVDGGVSFEKQLKQLLPQSVASIHEYNKLASAPVLPASAVSAMQNSEHATELDSSDPVAFIQSLLPAAKKAAANLGLEPLALIAQAALETGWGQRMFKNTSGQNSNNLFGIKAQANWQGQIAVVDTLEYRAGVAQKEKARFRAYESAEQSLHDYVDLIQSNPRYQAALAVASDTKAYFQRLQAAGYATDPNYAQKILSVMEGSAFKEVRNLLGK
ncbi:MAG: flagellar assembly peptidoglycan hydrolase FlgJ [Rheinheimera sp.]